jgi:hypothetical protein
MKLKDLKPVVVLEDSKKKDENSDIGKAPPIGKTGQWITTAQAAKELGVTMSRVRQYIMDGVLKAMSPEKGRRDNLVLASAVKALKDKGQKPGRPSKEEESKK